MDPTLNRLKAFLATISLSPQQESMAIASVIQMGLINCTHVLWRVSHLKYARTGTKRASG
jgi:hypothetical protein